MLLPQAFQALVGGHKLSNGEELELVAGLDIPAQQVRTSLCQLLRCICAYTNRAGLGQTLSQGPIVHPWCVRMGGLWAAGSCWELPQYQVCGQHKMCVCLCNDSSCCPNLVRGCLFSHLQGWLKLLYTSRCKKYEQGGSIEGTLAALEAEPAAGGQQQPGQQQQQQQQQQAAGAGGAAQPPAAAGQQQQLGGGGGSSMQTPGKGAGAAAAAAAAGEPQPMALSPLHVGPSSAVGGWGLGDNLDVIACRAEWLYHR